jgi:hypothetical protein
MCDFCHLDMRLWTTKLEEDFYHPMILNVIKNLRREARSNAEADMFIAIARMRKQRYNFDNWKAFAMRRNKLRLMFIAVILRTQTQTFGYCFDHWKKFTIQLGCHVLLQRYVRGFIARRRRLLIRRIRTRTVLVQKHARGMMASRKVRQRLIRLHWAATEIQRVVRGRLARVRVASMVFAYVDIGRRRLAQQRVEWHESRRNKAATAIQMCMRKFLRRHRMMKILAQKERVEDTEVAMREFEEKARIERELFMADLHTWYVQRKQVRDISILHEQSTVEQKKAIRRYRNRKDDEEKKKKAEMIEAAMQRLKEKTIERWIESWEEKIAALAIKYRTTCERCLILPESPEEVKLKALLLKNTQRQVKEVFRRADAQKIPMELPEAMAKARADVIDAEVQAEIVRLRQDMRREATERQAEEDRAALAEKEKNKLALKRKRVWAVRAIQGMGRCYLARGVLRAKARARYVKHFDPSKHEYYYEDKRTRRTMWFKPKSLGAYDIEMPNKWMVLRDSMGYRYYYNPQTWEQTWVAPLGTVFCQECGEDFASVWLRRDERLYCTSCFHAVSLYRLRSGECTADDIVFKPFEGDSNDAEHVDLEFIQDTNWTQYIIELDPLMKAAVEAEEREWREKHPELFLTDPVENDDHNASRNFLPGIGKKKKKHKKKHQKEKRSAGDSDDCKNEKKLPRIGGLGSLMRFGSSFNNTAAVK